MMTNKEYLFSKDDYDLAEYLVTFVRLFISEQTAPNDFKSIWNLVAIRNCFGSQIKKANERLWVYKDNMYILNEKGVTIN